MPTLIVYLPYDPANPGALAAGYDYAVLRDDRQLQTHGRAAADLLPSHARATEVVAVLPARAVSWHRVALPGKVAAGILSARAEPARVRAVLSGAMEEQLLDDAPDLHFAVFGPEQTDGPLWVAVCNLAWLRGTLAPLEAAGLVLSRLVAEGEPLADTARAFVAAAMQPAQITLCSAGGVSVLPLGPEAVAMAQACDAGLEVFAEPAVMGLAEQHLGAQGRIPVQAQTLTQRLEQAAGSRRNLAQLEFSPSRGGRARKRLGAVWQTVWHTPAWRPVRWACVALLLAQVVALNAVAWQHKTLLAQKRQQVNNVLLQTFPDIPVIVDAPVQMQRALRALALSRGMGDADLARLLTAVAATGTVDANKAVTALDFSANTLQLTATGLTQADADALASTLGPQSWQVRLQGEQLQVQRKANN